MGYSFTCKQTCLGVLNLSVTETIIIGNTFAFGFSLPGVFFVSRNGGTVCFELNLIVYGAFI